MICSTIPVVAKSPQPVAKTVGLCGHWITLCGKGKHSVSFFLGKIQAPVVIWYDRAKPEDEVYVHQNGEIIAAAPLDVPDGSFSFDYAPLDNEPGNDEIIITHEGRYNDSIVRIRVDCPENRCVPDYVKPPPMVETSIKCGKQWHQAGYVKKNTILLGDEKGFVDVVWDVVGTAEVRFFQDKALLKTITSNRSGVFTFYYDPELGEVFATTQGTGSVDYIFTCPYTPEVPEVPVYEFTCGPNAYEYEAPRSVEIKFPTELGTVDIEVTLVETVRVEFRQNNVPFYVLSGHNGTANFSYDFDPDKGKVTIETTGYGKVSVRAKCPYTTPDPDPVDMQGSCGNVVSTYPGWSNVTLDMGNISGTTTVDVILTGTPITIETTIKQTITESGSYTFPVDKSVPFVIKSRGNDYRLRASCPVRVPIETAMDCGTELTTDSFANVTVRYGSTPGNSTITANQIVAVYRDGVLQGMGTEVTFFYAGTGVVKVVCTVTDAQLTINATCPALLHQACGDPKDTHAAGAIVVVDFKIPLIRGHVKFFVTITGQVSLQWRLGSNVIKTQTVSEDFELVLNTAEGLRVVSTGTGTFAFSVDCAVPITVVDVQTLTEKVDCKTGETSGGVPGGATFVTATWTITTYSDGSKVTSAKTYDGVCKPVADVPIRPARWGVAMFANRKFTGGVLPEDITPEMADPQWNGGVKVNPSPSGRDYDHWTGIQDFADKVMTNIIVPSATNADAQFTSVIHTDDFVYFMWDKRAAPDITMILLDSGFEDLWYGVNWLNDLLGNYEDLPGYNPNLPHYQTVRYDDGTGERDWIIARTTDTVLPKFSPRPDRYSVQYKVN